MTALLCGAVSLHAGRERTQLLLSGKKPNELNIKVKVKFKSTGEGQGCKTKSKSGMFMVPLKKSKKYEVNSIENNYSIEVPLNWLTKSSCIWNVYKVEITTSHISMSKSRGVTGFLFNDLDKKGKTFLGSTTVYCNRKYINKKGEEEKGISCRDQNAGDRWTFFYNGFLNKDVLEYKMDFTFAEPGETPVGSSSADEVKSNMPVNITHQENESTDYATGQPVRQGAASTAPGSLNDEIQETDLLP